MDFIFQTIKNLGPWQFFFTYLAGLVLATLLGFIGMVVAKYVTGSTTWAERGFLIGILIGVVIPIVIVLVGTELAWYWKVCLIVGTVILEVVVGIMIPVLLLVSSLKHI